MVGKIMPNPKQKESLSKYGFRIDQTSISGSSTEKVSSMTDAYAMDPTTAEVGTTVYDSATGREFILNALPASDPANWKPKGDGDAEDSYRATAGTFDPLIAGQHINANQSILAANLPATKVYKLYFDADCAITFDLPIIGQSPMLSADKKTWNFYAGDEFEFFKTADSLAIDGEVS